MASTHEYPVTVSWSGGRDGSGSVKGDRSGVSSPISVPPEFQGPGNGTNPEELLASAVAACYSITFGIIAANRKLAYTNLTTNATGFVEQAGAQFTYTRILVKPTITLETGADDAAAAMAEDIAHKADMYCIITNAVRDKVKIEIEPTILR
ncbi:MAG TPA: OsmC family protein [Fimbriimonadaceae bacterium]|nr:OsmC family protein [Fimbriimonadaceae bacterium]